MTQTPRFALAAVLALTTTACTGLTPREIQQTLEGAYDVESRYDMKTIAGMFSGFAGGWAKPDTAIYDEIIGQVGRTYGSQVASGFETIYGSTLQRDITSYLNEQAPPWVMNLQSSLAGVDKQLNTVDMQANWLFVEKDPGKFEATQIFSGVSVFEDPDCPDSAALLCNQIEVTSDELLDAEYPIQVLSSTYVATDLGDTMELESHSLDFSYGRLGLYLLTNLILPDNPTEGIGLRDVTLAAINCRGLAGRVGGENGLTVNVAGVNVGLSLDDLIGNCEDSVFGVTTRFIDRFDAPLSMNLKGGGGILDTNRDGRIDQLNTGAVAGDLELTTLFNGQTEEGPVDGLYTGFRVGDVD